MNRILICGSNGLLGQRLSAMLANQTEYEVLNTGRQRSFVFDHRLFDYTQLDISRKRDVKSLVSSFQPDTVINAAAATNVDWCEGHREEAWKVNVTGVEILADACRKVGARLIHVSTDYVFDGKNGPYDERARPNPISYYGKTKLASENAILASEIRSAIVRTMVVYGTGIDVKPNFPLWVVNSLRTGTRIRCVTDQVASPTFVSDLAYGIVKVFEKDREGLYHVSGSEQVSRYDFAVKTAKAFGLDATLIAPVSTAEINSPAPRPLRSGFITLKAETELGMHFMDVAAGLHALRQEVSNTRKN